MLALRSGKIYTMDSDTPMEGVILIADGKIRAVDVRMDIPSDCRILDVAGKVITPGLIDAHTHLGIKEESIGWAGEDHNERTDPLTPEMDALDGINPADSGIASAFWGGVTTAMVAPGSANPIGGQCVVIKTLRRSNVEDMVVRRHAGLKIAFGENPRRSHGVENKRKPATRMAVAALIRGAFLKARMYMSKQGQDDFEPEPGLDTIARVLRGEMPLRAHAHRADDIVTAIRIAREFSARIVIEHGTESYQVVDVLKKEGVPVVLGPSMGTSTKLETSEKMMTTPAILAENDLLFAMMTDHPVNPSCFLPVAASLAVRYGLSESRALRMITADAAKILGLENRLGRIASGLDADLVVWNGHPLQTTCRPESVIIDGAVNAIEYQR